VDLLNCRFSIHKTSRKKNKKITAKITTLGEGAKKKKKQTHTPPKKNPKSMYMQENLT